MNIRPLSDRIVVSRVKAPEKTAGGLFIPDSAKATPEKGVVIALGEGERQENGTFATPSVKVGDTVLFEKFHGVEVERPDGGTYLVLSMSSVLCVIAD